MTFTTPNAPDVTGKARDLACGRIPKRSGQTARRRRKRNADRRPRWAPTAGDAKVSAVSRAMRVRLVQRLSTKRALKLDQSAALRRISRNIWVDAPPPKGQGCTGIGTRSAARSAEAHRRPVARYAVDDQEVRVAGELWRSRMPRVARKTHDAEELRTTPFARCSDQSCLASLLVFEPVGRSCAKRIRD